MQIYFPACGFGFWYLLGKYERMKHDKNSNNLIGSSGGSLICVCSLIDKKYPLYDTAMDCAKKVFDEYSNQGGKWCVPFQLCFLIQKSQDKTIPLWGCV